MKLLHKAIVAVVLSVSAGKSMAAPYYYGGRDYCKPGYRGFPCEECEGDCDYDWECAYGLKCMKRDVATGTANIDVPGCSGGQGKVYDVDYCYRPNQTPPPTLHGNRVCTPISPCGECEGYCAFDNDCNSPDLKCYTRRGSGWEQVPGCAGWGQRYWGYCSSIKPVYGSKVMNGDDTTDTTEDIDGDDGNNDDNDGNNGNNDDGNNRKLRGSE